MRKIVWLCGLLAALVLVRLSWVGVSGAGILETYRPLLADTCTSVVLAPGLEDVTVDHDTGQVFVSADNRRMRDSADDRNGIYMFPADAPDQARRVSLDAPAGFKPHGISLWKAPDSTRRLFAISHYAATDIGAARHTVEIFDIATDGTLTHLPQITVTDPVIHAPNDLVAIGPRAFYVSNDHGFSGILRMAEDFLALPVSDVVYFDGTRAEVVISGLAYANGIRISADASTLYVAEVSARQIRSWRRGADGTFTADKTWPMRMAADNIELDAQGNLWTAGHPNALAFLQHASDQTALSPSMVSRIDGETGTVTEVLYTDGEHLSGASVAAMHDGTLIVGSVFEDKLLLCRPGTEGT